MRFGVSLVADDLASLARRSRLAEEYGFDLIGIADSQSLFRDVYISLSVVAINTNHVLIGPVVTNPLTRHPAVTASAIASLAELSRGRVFVGLGSGDSAILNLKLRPASLSYLRESITTLRKLMMGQRAVWEGKEIYVRWAKQRIPVYLAAEGPQTLRLAGEVADGAIIHSGLTNEILQDSFRYITEGASPGGRDPQTLDVWVFAKANVAPTREQAVGEIKMALAGSANHAFRFTLEGKRVPAELVGPIKRLLEAYVMEEHETLRPTKNAHLPDELGLTDYLVERFAIAGTPEDCCAKVATLKEAGVQNVLFTTFGPNPERMMRVFAQEVMPHFR